MMLLGVTNAWGQTDYSGTYYIRSESSNKNTDGDYYLCPTKNWYLYKATDSYENDTDDDDDNGKPFLTTYQCKDGTYDVSKAVWIVQKHPTETNCYYVIQKKTGRYMVSNGTIGTDANRMRVHLESVADATALSDLGDLALFEMTSHDGHIDILPHSSDGRNGDSYKYLVVNFKNFNELTGSAGKTGGPSGTYGANTAGIIGLYDAEENHKWSFEDYITRPTISYNVSDKIIITAQSGEASPDIRYTIDGTTPSATNGSTYSEPFDPDDDVTTIKAVEIVNGELSNVATFNVQFPIGSTHPYLIQSKECEYYYMIPSAVVSGNTTINTLNVPCKTMAWYFKYAETVDDVHYYYVANNEGGYLYRTGDNVYLMSTLEDADGYKFKVVGTSADGYNLIPKGQSKCVYKTNGNVISNAHSPITMSGSITNDLGLWKLVPYSGSIAQNVPFTPSTDNATYYYQISNVNVNTKYILPTSYPITINTLDGLTDDRESMWVIREAGQDADGLLTYYTICNAYTSEYLCYVGSASDRGTGKVLKMMSATAEGYSADKAQFVIAQSKNGYNIIPKLIVDNTRDTNGSGHTKASYNCINRSSGKDVLGTWLDTDDNSHWTFTQVTDPVSCLEPIVTLDNDNARFSMSCMTNAAKIYYTLDGTTPSVPLSGTTLEYTNGSFVSLPSSVVKIIAVAATLADGSDKSSEVIRDKVDEPVITINADNGVTISSATDGVTIYYKLGGDSPTTVNGTQSSSIACVLPSQGPIKAFAVKDGLINSNIATESDIPAKTIAVSSANASLTSEDPVVYDGSAHQPSFTVKDGETTIASSEYTTAYSDNVNAGTATITITDKAAGDYHVSGSFTFPITQKGLTVTAKASEITYGDAPASDGVTYSGFVEGEDEDTDGMFTGTLTYTYNYSQFDDVDGAYTITPGGLTATNYAITFTPGTLTVNQKEVALVWSETPLTYNGNPQVPTATATGTVNNDEVVVTVTGAETNAGTNYTATASGLTGTKAGNYKLPSEVMTTFSIEKANLTATVSISDWTYGEDAETPSVMGNIEDGVVTYSYKVKDAEDETYTVTVPTNAGTYTVKAGIGATDNYLAGDATADFTISPKSIGDGNKVADGITIELTPTGELSAVKDDGTTLTEDTDFTCDITMDGADRMVTITGMGNYTGSANGIYANPTFKDPDGSGSEKAAAVYQAKRDMAYPSGITPYIVKKVNPTIGTMNIAPLDYIPEGVPVLLLSDTEAEGFVASPKEESTPKITDAVKNSNQLKVAPEGGVDVKDREAYMFYLGEFVLAFEGTIKKDNFYLMNPNYSNSQSGNNAASRRTLQFIIEDVETGIDNSQLSIPTSHLSNEWFNLDGRRLRGMPAQKGLYIVNGQKVVIK